MTPQEKADKLGQTYEDLGDQIEDLKTAKDKTTNEIKTFAAVEGTVDGKKTVVNGKEFTVGFITTDPDKVLDHGKLRRALDTDTWMSITTRIVDEKKLSHAIVKGKIKRKIVASCLVPSPVGPQKRVYVKNKGAKNANAKKNSGATKTAGGK